MINFHYITQRILYFKVLSWVISKILLKYFERKFVQTLNLQQLNRLELQLLHVQRNFLFLKADEYVQQEIAIQPYYY